MNTFTNSLLCSSELSLIKFYLLKAAESSSLRCLRNLDLGECRQLVREYMVPAVEQTIKSVSSVGNWKDEKDYVVFKLHGFLFILWMSTTLQNTTGIFLCIDTVFYLEILKVCKFEKYLVQCLCNVSEKVGKLLIDEIARLSNVAQQKDDKNLLLQLIEESLSQLYGLDEVCGKTSNIKLCHFMVKVTSHIKQQHLQVEILGKISKKLCNLCERFQQPQSNCNIFVKKMNIIEFDKRIAEFITKMKMSATATNTPSKIEIVKERCPKLVEALLCLLQSTNHLITIEWRSLFSWQTNDCGIEMIKDINTAECHDPLFRVFTSCKHLQTLVKGEMTLHRALQPLLDTLQFKFQDIEEIPSSQIQSEKKSHVEAFEMMNETSEEKLQHALFQIEENLVNDELCFEWLLTREEFYVDERWLRCVQTHSKMFVSVKIVRMLLDILSVFQEFDIKQDGLCANVYSSLKKVILDLLPLLTLPEQKEIVVYNFELISLHFDIYKHSFYLLPGDDSSSIKDTITGSLNKLVHRTVFTKDVMDGVIQACLIAPYVTLKELLTEGSRRNGYEKIVCQLLQAISWLVNLGHKDDDCLIFHGLREIMTSLANEKQEEQFLKLIEALMQPYNLPKFGTTEPALASAPTVSQHVVIRLLSSEEDDVILPILTLNILLKCFSCPLTSIEHRHWIIDQEPWKLLNVLLEMYQDCELFWEDWVSASRDESVDDVALKEAWSEMNVILILIQDHLVPILCKEISQRSLRYEDFVIPFRAQLETVDWIASMLIMPLLQHEIFKEYRIKIPSPEMTSLLLKQLNVESIQDEASPETFWKVYFKACAVSHEVFEICLSKLKESYPRKNEASDSEEIIHALARLLPCSSWAQWQRILRVVSEMMRYKYLILPNTWSADITFLPRIADPDDSDTKMSELLLLILAEISKNDWASCFVWNTTLKNYVLKMKEILLAIEEKKTFIATSHLLAHLVYISSNIVPESFQENINIILLDTFNRSLTHAGDKSCLSGIINMIPQNELKLTMSIKMDKIFSNNHN